MKRFLLIIIFILLLSFSVSAFAVDGNSPFFGEWAGIEHHAVSQYSAVLHYVSLSKYKTSDYFIYRIHHGGSITSPSSEDEMYSDHWEIVDDHLRVPTSPISFVDFYYDSETDTLFTNDPEVTYVRLP